MNHTHMKAFTRAESSTSHYERSKTMDNDIMKRMRELKGTILDNRKAIQDLQNDTNRAKHDLLFLMVKEGMEEYLEIKPAFFNRF